MCNLYRITTTFEAMRRLFRVEANLNLPMFGEIYPDREAPIIKADAGGARRIEIARWGVPGPAAAGRPVTNVRNLASPFWRAALNTPDRRCLVPVTAFCEWTAEPDPATGHKRKVWFDVPGAEAFVFAGITRWSAEGEPDRFAFLTCEPNALVGGVHPKAMPVILPEAAADAWLAGEPAPPLACAFADELMRIVPS